MFGTTLRGLAVGVLCTASLSLAHAAPALTGASALRGVGVERAAKDESARIELAASPRREKYCKDNETGNSAAAKEKSYKDCLKTWR